MHVECDNEWLLCRLIHETSFRHEKKVELGKVKVRLNECDSEWLLCRLISRPFFLEEGRVRGEGQS